MFEISWVRGTRINNGQDVTVRHREIELEIVNRLIRRIGDDRFELWFEAENSIQYDGKVLTILSSEKFAQNRIRQFFSDDLSQIASQVVGQQVALEFSMRNESTDEPAQDVSTDEARTEEPRQEKHFLDEKQILDSNLAIESKQENLVSSRIPTSARNGSSVENQARNKNAPVAAPSILKIHSDVETNGSDGNDSNGLSELKKVQSRRQNFNDLHSLKNFEFDNDNAVVKAAVQQTINRYGEFSPLYLYGPVGCGKTHLLRGIVSAFRKRRKMTRCIYMTAEQFTSNFIEALDGRGVADFRRKCRGLDVLAIDDVQFFGGKKATIIEFQSTVESLMREGKQIVLSADCSLAELRCFEPELINRIAGGLPCSIQYAGESSRKKIIERHAKAREISLSSPFASYLAENLGQDIRHLSGALNRIHAADLSGVPPKSIDELHSLILDLLQASRKTVTIREIESAVGSYCGINSKDMRSATRSQSVSTARMLAMFLSRQITGTAFSEIGHHFGGRSHSTVISADKKIKGWIERNHYISVNHTKCNISDVLKSIESKLKLG